MIVEAFERSHGPQNRQSHRQIESGAFLTHMRRSEIHGYRLIWIPEAGIHKSRLDPFAAFAHRGIGHTHQHEIARHSAAKQIDFHIHYMRVDSEYSGAPSLEQ